MQHSDAALLHPSQVDRELMQYESHLPSRTFQATKDRVADWIAQYSLEESADGRRKVHVAFMVEMIEYPEEEEGEITASTDDVTQLSYTAVGNVSIFQYGSDGEFFLSYLTFRAFLRQGFAREAVGTLMNWAFERLPGLKGTNARILADVDPRNSASLELLQSKFSARVIGSEQATMKVGNQWVDSVYLAVDRESFAECGWKQQYLHQYARVPKVYLDDLQNEDLIPESAWSCEAMKLALSPTDEAEIKEDTEESASVSMPSFLEFMGS
jgi:RimJ/RimL family protein N-acetyltransferase